MSAAPTVGTPAAAPNGAPPPDAPGAVEGAAAGAEQAEATPDEGKTLSQLLREGKAAKKPKPGEKADAAEPAEIADEPKSDEITADQLFTDEALATPEGAKRARAVILTAVKHAEQLHHEADRANVKARLEKKENAKFRAEVDAEKQRLGGIAQRLRHTLGVLHVRSNATAAERLAALADLAGESGPDGGRRYYEELSIGIATDGKAPEMTRAERQLAEKMERIEAERQNERAQAEREKLDWTHQNLQSNLAQLETSIGQVAASNPAQFPSIGALITQGRVTAQDVGSYVGDIIHEHAQAGTPIDRATAIGMLEASLSGTLGQPAQAESGSGQPMSPREEVTQTKHRRGATLLPNQADASSNSEKKEDHDERIGRLAKDPVFVNRLFRRKVV